MFNHLKKLKKIRSLSLPLALVIALIGANLAYAHPWGPSPYGYHWNKYGSSVTLGIYNQTSGRYYTQSDAARYDWSVNTILYLPNYSSHTNISVFSENAGDTGWAGLASIISWENQSLNHLGHVHAEANTYYTNSYSDNALRGVYCQEIGHAFGLDHSDTGDCMGAGYYNNAYTTGSHNWNDIYNTYRYTHH